MKNIIFLLVTSAILVASTVNGQTIGTNGQGLMDNSTQTDWDLLRAFDFPFIVRYPGGADTKFSFTDTHAPVKGWDMSLDTIQAHFAKYGTDENGDNDGLSKYTRKYNDQEALTVSYVDKLKDLNSYVPNHETMWNFNVFYAGKGRCMAALDDLVASGVRVPAVVFNNEVYSKGQYSFNFSEYRKDFEPYALEIKAKYPYMKIALCYAPNLDRSDHKKWNDSVDAYINSHPDLIDAVDVHLYFNKENLPLSWAAMPTTKRTVPVSSEDQVLSNAWKVFYDEATANDLIKEHVDYIKGKHPGIEIWCSEFNANPVSQFANTVSHGAFVFRKMMENAPDFEYFMLHNGISSDIGGIISQRLEQDDVPETQNNVVRCAYYSVLFAGTCLQNHAVEVGNFDPDGPGTYYVWYAQIGEQGYKVSPGVSAGLKISSLVNVYVSGRYPYSSAGSINLMGRVRNGQQKSYEVNGFHISDDDSIRANTFGFFIIQVDHPAFTVLCHDSTFISGYNTIFTYDTTVVKECAKCDRFFYRLFHGKFCNQCSSDNGGIIIEVHQTQVPIYDSVQVCDTIYDTGAILPELDHFCPYGENFDAFTGDLSNDLDTNDMNIPPDTAFVKQRSQQ